MLVQPKRERKKERERKRGGVHIRKEYSRTHDEDDEVSHLKVMKKSLKRAQVYQ